MREKGDCRCMVDTTSTAVPFIGVGAGQNLVRYFSLAWLIGVA